MQNEHIDIVVLRNKITHLGSHAGYDQLFNFLKSNRQLTIHDSWRREGGAANRFLTLAALYPFRWYFGNRFFTFNNYRGNTDAEKLAAKLNAGIVHFSHWEDSYASPFNFFKKNRHSKLIATAHQPVSWWQKNVKKFKDVSKLDALIVLAEKEKDFFNELMPGKVYQIEHGIDTDFFYPLQQEEETKTKSCVFAGNWLRNIPLLAEIAESVTTQRRDIHFNIINQHVDNKDHPLYKLHANKNISLYKNITDEQLRSIYRSSSLAVLPLKDSTANNGLMETAACGLPALISDVGGVKCYTTSAFCEYMPASANAKLFTDSIIALLDDPAAIKSRGQAAAAHMRNNFSWQKIAERTFNLYNKVLQNN